MLNCIDICVAAVVFHAILTVLLAFTVFSHRYLGAAYMLMTASAC